MRHGLFEPDILIAEVSAVGQHRSGRFSSEKRLMIAVLHDAVECYQKYVFAEDRIGQQLFAEAAAWLSCTSSDGLFSFESISEALDIEPDYVRRGLAAWHKQRLGARTGGSSSLPIAEAAGAV